MPGIFRRRRQANRRIMSKRRAQPVQEINVKKLLNYLSVLLVLSVFTFSITACNTVHGVGKDMQKAGEEVQEEADEHNN